MRRKRLVLKKKGTQFNQWPGVLKIDRLSGECDRLKGCVRYIFASLLLSLFLVNNLGSKNSMLKKFGQFVSYYKRKIFIKKFYKNCDLKTSSRPFCVCKELRKILKEEKTSIRK